MNSKDWLTTRQGRESVFPVLSGPGPYLNHAAVGPWARPTADAVRSFAAENMNEGSRRWRSWAERERLLRKQLSVLVGSTSPDDIALLKNTTEGICLVAAGLDWRHGDNLVLPSGEFPSNRLPWLQLPGPGVDAREVDVSGVADPENALLSAMDDRTRLLAVSAVQWEDGLRLDLERLGKACRRRGVLFFVDAIQQLGALPLDVDTQYIDFLAADAHKWLLAPEGIAVFFCREEHRATLKLQQVGWHMVDRNWDFQRDAWPPSSSALRFEAGSPNTMGQAALLASVDLLLESGMKRVSHRVLGNTEYLLRALNEVPGIRVMSRQETARRSGIVSFVHEKRASNDIYEKLREREVVCTVRGPGVRISPHFYQDERDLDVFLDALAHIV